MRCAAALALGACVLALGFQISVPYDLWWQLANGRLIWQNRQLVRSDAFTFTITRQPYLDKYWIFETCAYALHRLAGWNGLVALHVLLLAAVAASAAVFARRQPWWAFAALAVPSLLLLELRSSLRPYLFTLALLPPFCRAAHALTRDHPPASWKTLAGLLFLQIVWTNLHSEFPWGLWITSLFAAEAAVRAGRSAPSPRGALARALVAWVGCGLATLVSPFGLELPLGIFAEAKRVGVSSASAEWMSFLRYARPLSAFAWSALTALVLASFGLARRFSPARFLLFASFAFLSLRSFRFVGPMAAVGLFVGMENFSERARAADREPLWDRLASAGACAAGLLLFWAICTDRLYHAQRELKRFGIGYLTSELPTDCARFLRDQGLRGHFLNEWSYGGYLIWHNGPAVLVAEDGRTAPFPRRLSETVAAALQGAPEAWATLDRQYRLDGAVVPWYATGALAWLARQPEWACLWVGMHSSVWMKKTSLRAQGRASLELSERDLETFLLTDPEAAFAAEPWLTFPTAAFRRAVFFRALGLTRLAEAQVAALQAHAGDHELLKKFRAGEPAPPAPKRHDE